MSIRNKLVLGFSGLTGILIVLGALAWLYVGWLGENINGVVERRFPVAKFAVDIRVGAYEATIQQLRYMLDEKPETLERAKAVLAQMEQDFVKVDEYGQQYDDTALLQKSAAAQQAISRFSNLYERGVQALINRNLAVEIMVDRGDTVVANAGSFAVKQELEYGSLRDRNTPQSQLDSMIQKYILVNRIKALAYTIIQHEKQERIFRDGRYYQKIQQELPSLMGLLDNLKKITSEKGELENISTSRAAINEYTSAADQWIKNDTEVKSIVKEMNGLAEGVRKSAADVERGAWVKVMQAGNNSSALVSEFNMIIVIALLIGAAISIGLSIMIPKNIARAINRLKSVIFTVQKDNDLTLRADVSGKDEIAEMAQAFNGMMTNFQKAIHEVADASAHITVASEQTLAITEQSHQAIHSQQQETTQVSVAMNEMSATIGEVVGNIAHTATATDEALEQVNSGTLAMQKTIDLAQELVSIVEQTNLTVVELDRQSAEISSILDVINSLADQSNLLALNASIEAALAGQHGYGFSVVASEVKRLNGRTQDAISEITQVIEQLQQGSGKAVTSMAQSKIQAVDSSQQAIETGDALNAIAGVVQRINDMSSQIAAAAEEQGTVTEEVNRNIVQISEMTNQTAEGAAETLTASNELARLSSGLNKLVRRFVV